MKKLNRIRDAKASLAFAEKTFENSYWITKQQVSRERVERTSSS